MKSSFVEIHRSVLTANVQAARNGLCPGAELMAVVKANAYGHGLETMVAAAGRAGVRRFAVVQVSEALRVRAAAPEADILVLGVAEASDVPALREGRIRPVVVDLEHGRALGSAAHASGHRLPVDLKIDTGMGRLGMPWPQAVETCDAILREPGLDARGICSHLARVDPGATDPARVQAERFLAVTKDVEARLGRRLFRHLSNSRGILFYPEWDLDAVRAGISLYGYDASDPGGRYVTRPALQWKCFVAQVRRVPADFAVGYDSTYVTPTPTTLATLPLGYSDGYPRQLGNRAHVLIGGTRCPLVGRVSMNWITVDAGPHSDVTVGNEVVLIGRQGKASIWADELATLCDTIPHEILTGIPAHIERVPV